MTSESFNASEHLKVATAIVFGPIIAFASVLTVAVFFESPIGILVGWAIPVVALVFGYFMTRTNCDFEYVEITVKYAKAYFTVLLLLAAIVASAFLFLALSREMPFYGEGLRDASIDFGVISSYYVKRPPEYSVNWGRVAFPLLPSVASYICILIIQRLYFIPLSNHRQWVSEYGIFSKEQRRRNQASLSGSDHAKTE
jgi:hypothetical protein